MKAKTLGCLPFLILLANCNRHTNLTVLQPAQMKIPEHIATVAVVDRSKPSKGWLNVLEGAFSGEAIGQDRQSRAEAVRGLSAALTRTPRFAVKNTGIEMEGSKAGVNLPAPLDWREVERICQQYGADAVVTIESFDSDNSSAARRTETKRKNKDGKEYIDVNYDARMRTGVRMGWRMYDPATKIILDEFTTDDYLERTASGKTERSALSNLPSVVDISRRVAYNGGQRYGSRIAPLYVQVSRTYYAKAKGYSEQMKQAATYARSNDWKHAADIWKNIEVRATDNQKAAGRAAFNMAVASEVNGNLELALEWAQKASTKYGNKKARHYIQVIEQRQNDARKVEYQMNKKA
ncbi:MAG: DUF6340 family protein [Saprospiraceae bacterium]